MNLKHIVLSAAAAMFLLSGAAEFSTANAAVARITARPQDKEGRPADPQYIVQVNEDGTIFATQPVSGTVAATQSGTWTVQPGNTANTTPWVISGTVTATPNQTHGSAVGTTGYQPMLYNNSTGAANRAWAVQDGMNASQSGQTYAGVGAQCDDTSPTALTENNFGQLRMSCTNHSLVVRPYETQANSWSYAAATSGIVNTTTAVTIKASAGSGIRNCITGVQLTADTLGSATEFAIRDGAGGTVLWRFKLQTTGSTGFSNTFASPVCGTAATLLEIVTLTASVTGGVYANVQGYVAP